jgi:dTDP-4-dehydrorhamnose reductase
LRILILGASGMLGHQLWRHFSSTKLTTFGVIRKKRSAYRHSGLFSDERVIDNVDVNNFQGLCGVMEAVAPDVILNCIGVTKRRKNRDIAAASIRLNALFPHELAAWSLPRNMKIINFSTDCVFDGQKGSYTEKSPTSAQDLYGRTKALGEIIGENACTIRSSFIGPELQAGTELFEWFLAQRGVVKGFTRAIYSGLTTLELSRVVEDIIVNHPECTGLYHISSSPISKYNLLREILKFMPLPIELIPDGEFECDRSLNSHRFRKKYDYTPPSWESMISELTTYMQRKTNDI